jgi:uncharacterized membrane protein YeiB
VARFRRWHHDVLGTRTHVILTAIVFATIWSRFFRRGPLEYLLNAATKPAKYIR